jgi:hypothetical protein
MICGLCLSILSILSKFNVRKIGNFAYMKVNRFLLSYLGKFFEAITIAPLIIPKTNQSQIEDKAVGVLCSLFFIGAACMCIVLAA